MTLRQARKLDARRVHPWVQPHKIGTLYRAVARLRKSWRSGCPMRREMRSTGIDQPHRDYYSSNRLALQAWQMEDLRDRAPVWKWDAKVRGTRRSLS